MTLSNDFLTCRFDDAGKLLSVSHGALRLPFDGFAFDLGCQEQSVNGLLEYESMLEFRTWNLPDIRPTGKRFSRTPKSIAQAKDQITVTYALEQLDVAVSYVLMPTALKIDLRILNTTAAPLYLNSCCLWPRRRASFLTFPETLLSIAAKAPFWKTESRSRRVLSTLPPTRLYPEAT